MSERASELDDRCSLLNDDHTFAPLLSCTLSPPPLPALLSRGSYGFAPILERCMVTRKRGRPRRRLTDDIKDWTELSVASENCTEQNSMACKGVRWLWPSTLRNEEEPVQSSPWGQKLYKFTSVPAKVLPCPVPPFRPSRYRCQSPFNECLLLIIPCRCQGNRIQEKLPPDSCFAAGVAAAAELRKMRIHFRGNSPSFLSIISGVPHNIW